MNRLSGVAVPVRGGAGGTGGSSWVDPVINRVTSAPPGAPTPGDRYIIAAVASGVWTGKENYIADWNGATWDFTAPVTGLTAYVDAETEYYSYNGAAWVMESFGPHKTTHENGGTDELSVAGLNGELADPQPPKAHASSHNAGGGDALAIDAAAVTGSLRTIGTGALQAAAGNDARLSDARTPTAHKASHEPGGGDAMSVDAAAVTGSLRTVGTGALQACAGNDARLSDARTPTAHGASHTNGTDNVADMVGDSGSGGVHGLVPAPAAGDAAAGKFLKADGAWAAPAGVGDVVGPAGATDSGPALFDGATGKLLKDGGAAGTAFNKSFGTGVGEVCQGNDARLSDARTPIAHKTSHEPGGGDAMTVDAAAATGSLRTVGTGGLQACAGNDARLSDARTPVSHASSHNAGGGDALAIDAVAGTGSLRTLGTAATAACAGNDSRLSDARTPVSHASSHNAGGGDALAIDAVAGTGSLRTLGTAATAACAGNDSRLSDSRTPIAHATSHKSGGGDAVKLDELAAPTDVTTLDATTGAHGLLPKLGGGSTNYLRADGTWAAPPGSGGAVTLNEPAGDNSAGTQAIFDSAIVGESVAFPDLLYLKSDGKWWKSDADAAASMPGLRMALETKAADATCSMLVIGRVRDDDWNWTIGGLIYASTTAGGLTQTAPSGSADIIQIVGIAYHADKMIFDPSPVTAELV